MTFHEGALMASLRATYGIDLRNPGMSVPDLASHVVWLPPGSPLWMAVGGPMAWSVEQRAMHALEFRLRVLDWRLRNSKGEQPHPTPDPPYAHERAEQVASVRRKADAYLRRQAKREG
jgi:hypothetical protein